MIYFSMIKSMEIYWKLEGTFMTFFRTGISYIALEPIYVKVDNQ
jgi:hypothetical protein